jgi:hypothetical protein
MKERIERYGGSFRFETSPEGTKLYAVIPLPERATMNSLRVFIVDDNFVARHGLRSILEAEEQICVAGEASTGKEAIKCLGETKADVILMGYPHAGFKRHRSYYVAPEPTAQAKILIMTVVEDPIILASTIFSGARAIFRTGTLTRQCWWTPYGGLQRVRW